MLCLQLSEKVRLDHRVQTIQLPAEIHLQENHVVMWLDGEKLKLMGSLLMSEGGGRVIDRHVCEEQWPGLPANVTCAGGYKTRILSGMFSVLSVETCSVDKHIKK